MIFIRFSLIFIDFSLIFIDFLYLGKLSEAHWGSVIDFHWFSLDFHWFSSIFHWFLSIFYILGGSLGALGGSWRGFLGALGLRGARVDFFDFLSIFSLKILIFHSEKKKKATKTAAEWVRSCPRTIVKTTVMRGASSELATIGAILAARTPTEKLCLGKNPRDIIGKSFLQQLGA